MANGTTWERTWTSTEADILYRVIGLGRRSDLGYAKAVQLVKEGEPAINTYTSELAQLLLDTATSLRNLPQYAAA